MTSVTNYSYDSKFETKVIGMGLNRGMFAFSDKHNGYISPITRELYEAYKNGTLTANYVNSLLESLK